MKERGHREGSEEVMKGQKMRHFSCHASRVTVNVTPPYPAEAKCDGAPKGQRVHSPGQGERSETTPWVGKPPAWRPIRGKSNTL